MCVPRGIDPAAIRPPLKERQSMQIVLSSCNLAEAERDVDRARPLPHRADAAREEELEVAYAGDTLDIGFNSRYLLDMMAQVEGDTAQFVFADANSPTIVRDPATAALLAASIDGIRLYCWKIKPIFWLR